MKYVLSLFIVIMLARPAFPHPPQGMDLRIYGERVEISVHHSVSASLYKGHLINRIKLSLNGMKIVDQYFIAQESAKQDAIYLVPGLKIGDRLRIQAFCNQYGELDKEIVVE